MTESEEQKNAGEKLTLEDAVSLVNGYANLCEIWVREARRGDSLWDRDKDRSVIYLEKLGDMVGELWELWHRTTHQYPILRPVIRRMGASVLNSLQDVVVMDDTLDDDDIDNMQWDVQKVICLTSKLMEERMGKDPWRMCCRDSSLRCRHSNDYEEEGSDWECYHCEDRGYHADEAKEAEPADEGSDTEEEKPEVPDDQTDEEHLKYSDYTCLYDDNVYCSAAPRAPDIRDIERVKKELCSVCRAGKCPKLDDVICPNGGYSAGRCRDCELRPRSPAEEYFRMEAERMKRMEAEWARRRAGLHKNDRKD